MSAVVYSLVNRCLPGGMWWRVVNEGEDASDCATAHRETISQVLSFLEFLVGASLFFERFMWKASE